jgi:hypothetical protein
MGTECVLYLSCKGLEAPTWQRSAASLDRAAASEGCLGVRHLYIRSMKAGGLATESAMCDMYDMAASYLLHGPTDHKRLSGKRLGPNAVANSLSTKNIINNISIIYQ